jgi:alpha-D-xyloside xylohydrolase
MSQPFSRVQVDGGRLRGQLSSGMWIAIDASVPLEGTLRLRCRPESSTTGEQAQGLLLPGFRDRAPAVVSAAEDHVVIEGPAVSACWDRDGRGFRFGSYQRFDEPSADTVPVTCGYRPGDAKQPGCWAEAIRLSPDCGVYGGGESYQGPNLRGRTRRLRNTEVDRAAGRDTAYLNVPLLWSDAGWGLLVNTGSPVKADIAATHSEALLLEIPGDELDLIMFSGDAPTILRRYHELTGRPRRLPDWAFGVWMSRSSYFTAAEMVAVADDLAAADCPVDVMHTDEWLEEIVLNTSAWSTPPDRARYPSGWTDQLSQRGIRTSVWINPYLAAGSDLADWAITCGFITVDGRGEPLGAADNPDTLPVDFYSPDARQWWQDRLARTITEEKIAAVLADFGEELDPGAVLADGSSGAARHNTYGSRYAHAVADAGEQARGDDFVALCRSGTAGGQRFAAHWAGDLPATWSGLTSTLRALLSMSLSGLSTVTCDAGGYWTPQSYERTRDARRTMAPGQLIAEVDPELYARWAQWAALLPLMRFHGVGVREPTAYPEPARSAVVAACRFRKTLQPYVIEAARIASERGTPIIQPMVLAYPGNRAARDADLQYLFGPKMLVAPLLEPGGVRSLWVPPGLWQPMVGAPQVDGPGWTTVHCALDQFPVWRRFDA